MFLSVVASALISDYAMLPIRVKSSVFHANERVLILQIGKQITIEYFSESTSTDRGDGADSVSLRFPRVKAVWEDGDRNI